MSRFSGQVALVTGAGSGLGRATAKLLAAEGATVGCFDVAADAAETVVNEIEKDGGRAVAQACDVSDPASVRAGVDNVVGDLGPPRVLCNCAGIGHFGHSHEVAFEEWSRILAVNLSGTFLMCQAVLPHLLEGGGNIVNVASTAGLIGQPYSAAYCASKGGVIMLTKALALEYIERGVRVNAIAPGMMDTPMLQNWGIPEGASRKLVFKLMSPMGSTTPDNVAEVIAMLASDTGRYMTGSIVTIDGGLTI